MPIQEIKKFKEIYLKYLDIFKDKIKDEYIDNLFNEDRSKRIELKTIHTKINQEPEPLTEDIIREMLRECGIDSLDINRQIVIQGIDVFKNIKKKPDFYVKSADADTNSLFFEIEHLNKDLEKTGDGEGLEQAREWYNVDPTFAFQYDSIITNFFDWWILKYDFDERKYIYLSKKPWEMLEIIINIRLGRGREYLLIEEEQKQEITSKFYNEFQERLKRLLGLPSRLEINIEINNYNKPDNISDDEYKQNLIGYYRTIFSRLLFIKILESWKMLPFDPISIILREEKRHWSSDLRSLFFEVFNKTLKRRPKEIPQKFNKLPYLNGGLFRPSGMELDDSGNLRDVHLNSEAIKDIWVFFKRYKFVKGDNETNLKDSNTINPEILGYIFERSIGDERKKTGSFYTPEELTDYMAEYTIYPYIIEKINNRFLDILKIQNISDIDFLLNKAEVYKYLLTEILPNIKICDPACGSGAFIKKAADKLLYLYKKGYKGCGRALIYKEKEATKKDSQMPFPDIYSIKRYIIQKNIYGVDINPSAIEICELRLWLWVVQLPSELMDSTEYLEVPSLPNIEYNIRCGNSLIGFHEFERLGELGTEKFRRIDEKFLSTYGSAIKDIINQKETLINCYYEKDESIEEYKKNQIRDNINSIIFNFKEQLNKLLLSDYQNSNLIIPINPIYISSFIKKEKYTNLLQDKIREMNISSNITYFKINFKYPVGIDYKSIREIDGITCSLKRNTEKIISIFPTSSFRFEYYSEYKDKPLSKFIVSLISNWEDVENIKFKKKIDLNDIKLINPFYWVMEFSEIFKEKDHNNNGFDIIIGNPPFIRADTEDDFFLLQRNILSQLPVFETLWEKWDIFVAFIERCIRNLLRKNGKFAFVASDAICTVKYAEKIRNWLQNNYNIPLIDYFEDFDVFKGVGINPILLFVNINKNINKTRKIIHSDNFTNTNEYKLNQKSKYFWKKKVPKILSIDFKNIERLGNICYISKGMVPNADEKTAKGEFTKNDLISNKYSKLNNKMYIEGKNTSRFKIEQIKYFEWGTERSPSKLSRPTFPELYIGKKILRGSQTEGLIDLNDIITNHSFYVFRKYNDLKGINNNSIRNSLAKNNPNNSRKELENFSKKYSYQYLLAIINSTFAKKYLNGIRRHKLEDTFYPDDFRDLPIKSFEEQTFFNKLINILQFLYQFDGNKDIIDLFDNKILNYIIYEIYFEEKLKEAELYQNLLEEIKDKITKINYDDWIKLNFRELKDEELRIKKDIEKKNIHIINEIYKNFNTDIIKEKIAKMKDFEWIKLIET